MPLNQALCKVYFTNRNGHEIGQSKRPDVENLQVRFRMACGVTYVELGFRGSEKYFNPEKYGLW